MARKRKKRKRFSATKTVKAMAREQIGVVPPTRTVPDRKKKKTSEKHKPTLREWLSETE